MDPCSPRDLTFSYIILRARWLQFSAPLTIAVSFHIRTFTRLSMAEPVTENTHQPAVSRESSPDENDKLKEVLHTDLLRDEHDPDLNKTPEERAAIVCTPETICTADC